MRRIENNQIVCAVIKRKVREITLVIRINYERSSVAKICINFPFVTESHPWIILIEIKHFPSAADIQDWCVWFAQVVSPFLPVAFLKSVQEYTKVVY